MMLLLRSIRTKIALTIVAAAIAMTTMLAAVHVAEAKCKRYVGNHCISVICPAGYRPYYRDVPGWGCKRNLPR